MLGDDPPYLSVGTEVSAKYKGAFCEAKIRKVVRSVKCRVTYKQGLGTATVTDDQIKGTLRVGASVEARHADKKDFIEATITKIQDCSQYTVVFDDGDITTLRRTALCLKSGRHFAESETLDQLPLTHPEHFGNPVIGGRRGRRSRQAQDDSSEDEESPPRGSPSGSGIGGKEGVETEPEIGRVVCVELGDKKKKDNWFPGLVVAPTAQDTVRIRVRDDYLVRSFKDARYYTVPKKEASEFTKELGAKVENSTLKLAVEKALLFLEKNELPPHWDRDSLFGNSLSSGNSDTDADLDSDSSDDEPREEKDHFVAQLYKFMDDRGTPINTCPMIGSEDIDLYRLFRAVYKLGGYNRVTNQNQWKSITRRLAITSPSNPTTHNLVKQAYKKFLHSFEDFYRKLGCTMVNHPRGSMRKQRPGRSLIRDKDRNTPVPLLPKQEKEKEQEDEKKLLPDEEKKEKVLPAVSPMEEESKSKETAVKKKEEEQSSPSGADSDVNIEVESTTESSSSEKSQKPSRFTPVPSNRAKTTTKPKEELKKMKGHEKKKPEPASSSSSTSSQSSSSVPVTKKEKNKEEESAKTRSKSKDDKNKESRENREVSTEKNKGTSSKQRRMTDDDLKKQQRGRKKKEETEKSREKDENSGTESSSAPCYKGPIQLGDRLKVYYGPTHESKVTYEAKVIGIQRIDEDADLDYLVHYTGWNTRYDEWIKATRIAQNFTQQQGRLKRTKGTPRPQTPSATSAPKMSKMPNTTQNSRRRAQSVAPSSSKPSSGSSAPVPSSGANNASSKEKEPARSTTPLSVASSSSRTKSPATPASRPTRNTARNAENVGIELRTRRTRRMSGHTDLSVITESEDSDAYETDNTEPERARTRSRGTEERRRREVRRRVEDRIKPDENSEGEDDKDANEELPRRTRRLRRTVKKVQDAKEEMESGTGLFNDETDEPEENEEDNDLEDETEEAEPLAEPFEKTTNAEEAPKGRDFDLNQIRSELKGFDKAVKMEVIRVEAEAEGDQDEKMKIEELEKDTKEESKDVTNIEDVETELKPIVEEVVVKPSSPVPTTEDVYEFKEPEPFEFEVRNKRDSGSEKEKLGIKKRVFDEDPKSPKKKQKVAPTTPTKEVKPDTGMSSPPTAAVSPISSETEPKKKLKRSPVIKRPEEPEAVESSVIKCAPKEVVDKIPEKIPVPLPPPLAEEPPKPIVPNSDLLFSDIPADESVADADDIEDRLIISETEVPEVEENKTTTFPSYSRDSPLCEKKEITTLSEEKKEITALSVINVANSGLLGSKDREDRTDQKQADPANFAHTIILTTATATVSGCLTGNPVIERKMLEAKVPIAVGLPLTLVPAPISTRLPATASIEEKLSAAAMAFRQQKPKDTKRDEESEMKKGALKKAEALKKSKQQPEPADHNLKQFKIDDKKKDVAKEENKDENPEKIELRVITVRQKEEEAEKAHEKARKEPELKKNIETKVNEHRRMLEKRQVDPLKEILESTELEKQKPRKKILSQEFLESTDSSDSDQKLVIDNSEEKIDKTETIPEKTVSAEKTLEKITIDRPEVTISETKAKVDAIDHQSFMQIEQKMIPIIIKNEEEGENMNLLCEEEIPGSPAPPIEILEPDDGSSAQSKEKNEKKIVILEMPFASAPTSGASSTNQGGIAIVATSAPVQGHAVVKQLAQVVAGGAIQVVQGRRESNDAAPVIDNTPPTTPDSTASTIVGSPRAEERVGVSSPGSDDNKPAEIDEEPKGNFVDALEESTIESTLEKPAGIKRPADDSGMSRKRKRNRKNSECVKEKRGTRISGRITRQGPVGSDSDTSEGSNAGGNSAGEGVINAVGDAFMRDHKPLKYNFYVDLDAEHDGNQRIGLLQQKLTELKKTYNLVKAELAIIERRRKKLRRREREAKKLSIAALKAAKAEMQQGCA